VTVRAQWAGDAGAADTAQAAYFLAFLIEERKQVADDLARSRAQLRNCVEGTHVVGLRAMGLARFHVRELEAKRGEVDRLIAALKRRFAGLWSGEAMERNAPDRPDECWDPTLYGPQQPLLRLWPSPDVADSARRCR
jgi:hypothetical protein